MFPVIVSLPVDPDAPVSLVLTDEDPRGGVGQLGSVLIQPSEGPPLDRGTIRGPYSGSDGSYSYTVTIYRKDPFGRDYASDKYRIKYTKDPLGRWSPVAAQEIGGGQPVDPPKPLYPKPSPTPAPTPRG